MEFIRQNIVALLLTIMSAMVGVIVILLDRDSALWVGVGGSLLAAAFVSSLDFVKKLSDEGVDKFRQAARASGLRMVHQNRNIASYSDLVAKASRIDVSGYSLASFISQHGSTVKTRAHQGHLEVRVLLVDPTSTASTDQAALESAAGGSFAPQVAKLQQEFAGEARITVKTITTALPTMVFRIDDRMFVGPHFALASSQVATFELTSGWMHDQYTAVFEQLWTLAT